MRNQPIRALINRSCSTIYGSKLCYINDYINSMSFTVLILVVKINNYKYMSKLNFNIKKLAVT